MNINFSVRALLDSTHERYPSGSDEQLSPAEKMEFRGIATHFYGANHLHIESDTYVLFPEVLPKDLLVALQEAEDKLKAFLGWSAEHAQDQPPPVDEPPVDTPPVEEVVDTPPQDPSTEEPAEQPVSDPVQDQPQDVEQPADQEQDQAEAADQEQDQAEAADQAPPNEEASQ